MKRAAPSVYNTIRDCGPSVLFAHKCPEIKPMLATFGSIAKLESVLFAFLHIGVRIPRICLHTCLSIWADFTQLGFDIEEYIARHLGDAISSLPLNHRVVFANSLRAYLSTGLVEGFQGILADIATTKSTNNGECCQILGCVCMLVNDSSMLQLVTAHDLEPLKAIKHYLSLAQDKKVTKRNRISAIFSDSEVDAQEGDVDEQDIDPFCLSTTEDSASNCGVSTTSTNSDDSQADTVVQNDLEQQFFSF